MTCCGLLLKCVVIVVVSINRSDKNLPTRLIYLTPAGNLKIDSCTTCSHGYHVPEKPLKIDTFVVAVVKWHQASLLLADYQNCRVPFLLSLSLSLCFTCMHMYTFKLTRGPFPMRVPGIPEFYINLWPLEWQVTSWNGPSKVYKMYHFTSP